MTSFSQRAHAQVTHALARLPPGTARDALARDTDLLLDRAGHSLADLVRFVADPGETRALRTAACWVVAQFDAGLALDALLHVLSHDEDEALQSAAAVALASLGRRRSVPPLIERLSDGDPRVRRWSAYALGQIGDPRAAPALIACVQDAAERASVRAHACEALAHVGGAEAVAPLLAALADAAIEVRFWAAFSLGEVADGRAVDALASRQTDHAVVPGWWSVGEEAGAAIARIRARVG